MAAISERIMPYIRKIKIHEVNWNGVSEFFHSFWIRSIVIIGLCPIFIALPAITFLLAKDHGSFSMYILSFILLLPWILIPCLFILHISNRTKPGQILAYSVSGLFFITYIIWIVVLGKFW